MNSEKNMGACRMHGETGMVAVQSAQDLGYIAPSLFFVAGIGAYLAAYHLLLFFRQQDRKDALAFSVACGGIAGYALASLLGYRSASLETTTLSLKLQVVFIYATALSISGYVVLQLNQRLAIQLWRALLALVACLLLMNIFTPQLSFFSQFSGIRTVALPWGETVTTPQGVVGFDFLVHYAMFALFIAFLLGLSVALYRQHNKREALSLLAYVITVIGTAIFDCLVDQGIIHWFYLTEYGFLMMTIFVSFSMSARESQSIQMERALRRSEEKFRRIFESMPDGYIMTDLAGTIRLVNPAAARSLGYDHPEELIGKDLGQNVYELPRYFNEMLKRLEHSDLITGQEIQCRRKDASLITAATNLQLTRGDTGEAEGVEGIFRDVTRERDLENHLRQAEKMQAIGTLAGGIAHDFNNILVPMIGYAELVQNALPEESELSRYVREIEKAGNRARQLVQQIMTFSRQSGLERKPVRLSLLVADALELLRHTIPSTIQIKEEFAEGMPPVFADVSQVHQVVMNLGINAFHAMEETGGLLTIRVYRAEFSSPAECISLGIQPAAYCCLSISDTGTGMSEITRQRVFEPYFTTKEEGKGTGLGLATVHGIVQSHGGAIEVRSTLGAGSEFLAYFPFAGEIAELSRPEREDTLLRGNGECILFVDDDAIVLEVIGRLLKQMGYTPVTHGNVEEARRDFHQSPGKFEIALLDNTMPKTTGLEFAQELLALRPGLPIILMTGSASANVINRARRCGIARVLAKPADSLELGRALYEVLHP